MRFDKNKTRRIGGLLLDALMVVFVFTFSWSDTKVTDRNSRCILTISASPVDQLAFGDSNSISESFLKVISKIQLASSEFCGLTSDFPNLEIAISTAFLIPRSLYNTFYSNTTINAP